MTSCQFLGLLKSIHIKRPPKQLSVGGSKCNLSVFGFEPIVLQTQNDLTCLPVELSKNKPEACSRRGLTNSLEHV